MSLKVVIVVCLLFSWNDLSCQIAFYLYCEVERSMSFSINIMKKIFVGSYFYYICIDIYLVCVEFSHKSHAEKEKVRK